MVAGDPKAATQLLPLVYEELRKLAASEVAREKPGQTLQSHRARSRGLAALGGAGRTAFLEQPGGHFFGAAA